MMHDEAQARRIALQGLYQADVQGDEFLYATPDGLGGFIEQATNDLNVREIAAKMTREAWTFHGRADEWMAKLAPKWPVYRMAVVDRNILRLAAWELLNCPETPPKVVLDEAINLGKEFSTGDSGAFINGVLDALLKEHLKQGEKKE